MKKLYALTVAILGVTLIHAQNSYVHQVIFLNEGWFDYFNDTLMVPPSLGTYDPVAKTYTEFATIPDARFGTDVVIDDAIYVAADKWLIKYDMNTLQELDRVLVPGIRKIAVWGNYLIVTRGEFMQSFDSYVHLYQKSTLTLFNTLDTVTGPKYSVEGVAVMNDSAYLAVTNGFVWGDEKGIIGIVDLNQWSYAAEVDLGFDARNADNVMTEGGFIYTLNNKDYSGSSISKYDPVTRSFSVFNNVAINSGCGTSALANGHIYYMEYAVNHLARFSTGSLTVIDTLAATAAYYGLVDDELNQQLYATVTDYVSSGRAYILEYSGVIKDSFDVGISAGSIALDLRNVSGTELLPSAAFVVSPNPTQDVVIISAPHRIKSLLVMDQVGRVVEAQRPASHSLTMDCSGLATGVYFIEATFESGTKSVQKIVRR